MLLTIQRPWPRCSYFVWLCGLYYGALHVLKSFHALCPRVSSFFLALWSPCLGKRKLVCVLLMHLFVCFVRVSFCHFSLTLGVGGWLQFVIAALPRLFYKLFCLFQGMLQTISDMINQFACATMKGLPEHLLHLIVLCIKQLCFVQTM